MESDVRCTSVLLYILVHVLSAVPAAACLCVRASRHSAFQRILRRSLAHFTFEASMPARTSGPERDRVVNWESDSQSCDLAGGMCVYYGEREGLV